MNVRFGNLVLDLWFPIWKLRPMNTILKTWREETEKSVTDAAKAAGVTPAMWSRWENKKRPIPAERAVKIEGAIGVSRHDMRPDIFGPKPGASA